jgi:hypothetical protein
MAEYGEVAPPVFQKQDLEGVKALLPGPGEAAVVAEPALSEAAQVVGLSVAEPPEAVQRARAAIAVFMAWGQRGVAQVGTEVALLLIEAATEFWNAQPWVLFGPEQPLELVFEGDLTQRCEAVMLQSDGQAQGLAVYEDKGAVARIHALQASGQAEEAKRLSGFAVVLEGRPAYAAEALAHAGKVPRLPLPVRSGRNGPSAPELAECVALGAALRALSRLDAQGRATAEAAAGGMRVQASAVSPSAGR